MRTRLLTLLAMLAMLAGCTASQAQAILQTHTQHVATPTHTDLIAQLVARHNHTTMRNVLHKLRKQVHRTPYVFSGATPYGWDCSGMVVWAYEQLGITLPHSANKQAHAGKPTRNPHAGDIVLFRKRWSNTYYHAAIYLGHGKVINANSMWRTTVVQPLTDYAGDHIRYVQVVQQ